jgi:cellulose synthase/poly-beta-1,6-N-acetylglucosamine synthase-like glycosyltransferase
VFWFWFFAGPALALSILALRGERKRARFVAERLEADPNGPAPQASVIVPVDGPQEGLRENLAALAALDYQDYELIMAVRRAADIPPGVLPGRVTVSLGASGNGKAHPRVQNLMAGVRASRKRSEILAFADGGCRVSKGWLRALVAPLAEADGGVSTGYVWYAPEPPDFWSLVRSVWNAPIAGLLGPGDNPFAWTGSMAMRKETFFELGIPDVWRGATSEDGALTRAAHRAGRSISFAPGAMAACTGRTSAGAFLGWARRQMVLARLYVPRLWWGALGAHIFYCGGMAAAITASVRGSRGAEWVLVVQLGLGMLKGVNRATLARAELPDFEAWFKRHAWVHALWVPLATWLWLVVLITSAVPFPERKRESSSQGA